MSSHSEILQNAKTEQQRDLATSSKHSRNLHHLIIQLVESNSSTSATSLLDKISTIHELENSATVFLQREFARNCKLLDERRARVERMIRKSQLAFSGGGGGNCVEEMQRRCEVVDRELRILESTLANVGG
ncbi:uncharacterized protein LODBEIA_P03550 [Lodderomyces beijingensis]|uniref:Uncharacterized protein n=1 Tax=Lodderomyces beijingensis TaxID=1775926 RepID=A0ABP0ZD80_9ASCO